MSPEQRKMARHALGLEYGCRLSYRNRYVAGLGTTHEAAWDDLVKRGLAERGSNGIAIVGFCLTEAGAHAVLESGEKLDREDFPTRPLHEDRPAHPSDTRPERSPTETTGE